MRYKVNELNNRMDVIDSRDVISRLEELEEERAGLVEAVEAAQEEVDSIEDDLDAQSADEDLDAAKRELDSWEEDNLDELLELQKLAEEGERAEDWHHGATLIRETYFTDYCQQLVEDIGDLPRGLPSYIENNINWDGVAQDLQVDYIELDFGGVTYYARG